MDPVARRWRDHLRQQPVPGGQRISSYRFERADPHDPSEALVHASLVLDLYRTWMELRPELRRHCTATREVWTDAQQAARPGMSAILGAPVDLNGAACYPLVLDFGPASVDGWLAKLIASELQVEEDSILDVAQHQLVLDGRRVDLTKLEFEVLKYLFERPGKVVERASLLRDVWGYDYAGGSNVIEALVKAIRRKLGDRSGAIETVRGLGYRFVA